MLQYRTVLLALAAFGIILHSVDLISAGGVLLILKSIISMLVSVFVLVGLFVVMAVTLRSANRVRSGADVPMQTVVQAVVSIIAPFCVTVFVMDTGGGAVLRANSFLSFLPEGNLLAVDGWAGRSSIVYLILFLLLTIGLLWNKLKVNIPIESFTRPKLPRLALTSSRAARRDKRLKEFIVNNQ
ncbi:MAG: hypothetical protein JWN28_617 [Candidatus Saccharibacteria bacterium]|nr:hypothetical protein [Candidatus Saccharibacteria bacterium]